MKNKSTFIFTIIFIIIVIASVLISLTADEIYITIISTISTFTS